MSHCIMLFRWDNFSNFLNTVNKAGKCLEVTKLRARILDA